jgi:hypothetical protein
MLDFSSMALSNMALKFFPLAPIPDVGGKGCSTPQRYCETVRSVTKGSATVADNLNESRYRQ